MQCAVQISIYVISKVQCPVYICIRFCTSRYSLVPTTHRYMAMRGPQIPQLE